MTYLFGNWKFVPLNPPHLFFTPPRPSPLATIGFFSVFMSYTAAIWEV